MNDLYRPLPLTVVRIARSGGRDLADEEGAGFLATGMDCGGTRRLSVLALVDNFT